MTFFQSIFVSSDTRIRAGWRLLIQIVLSLLFLIPLQLLVSPLGGNSIQIIATAIAITLAVWVSGIILDKRPIRDFGLEGGLLWWKECAAGFFMATGVMSLIVLIQFSAGWIEFTGFGWDRPSDRGFLPVFAGYVVMMAVVGFYEELWARGYQLKNLAEGFYTGNNKMIAGLSAIAVSSLFFGLLHLNNPNATMFGGTVIVLAGVMLAIPYVMTGRLGYSVGLHFAWNVIQGGIYGLPVSGIAFRQSVLQFELSGPEIWTGGRFGPEGGMLGILGVILLMLISVAWLRMKGFEISISEKLFHPPETDRY